MWLIALEADDLGLKAISSVYMQPELQTERVCLHSRLASRPCIPDESLRSVQSAD